MIVLDLYAEVKPVWINSDQFYGVPYIWKVLFSLSANSMHYYPPFIFIHKKLV
jgi:alpha-N-acetylglucosaminidase